MKHTIEQTIFACLCELERDRLTMVDRLGAQRQRKLRRLAGQLSQYTFFRQRHSGRINVMKDFMNPSKRGGVDSHARSPAEESVNGAVSVAAPEKFPEQLPEQWFQARTPNVMMGQAVTQDIIVDDSLAGVQLHTYFIHDESYFESFAVDFERLTLRAVAAKAGNVVVTLVGFKYLPKGVIQTIKVAMKLAIIPDPKTLWQNLPSDSNARFHKPDEAAQLLNSERFLMAGGSVRGRAHAHKGTHRDDDFYMIANTSGWSVLAVADGAGSCQWSRRGAQLAVQTSVGALDKTLNSETGETLQKAYRACLSEASDAHKKALQDSFRETVVKAVYEAIFAIQQAANESAEDTVKDFSTTLLLAAICPVNDGYIVLTFWVGDGALVLLHDDQVTLMGEADAGQYAGQTRFLSARIIEDSSVYQRIRIKKISHFTGLILATDGVTDPYFGTDAALKDVPTWQNLLKEVRTCLNDHAQGEAKLLEWLGFWSPGNHDDRTLALLLPK